VNNKEMREFVKEAYKEGFINANDFETCDFGLNWEVSDTKKKLDELEKVDDLLP